MDTHCVQKKNIHSRFVFISMENVQISTKISGNISEETSIPSV